MSVSVLCTGTKRNLLLLHILIHCLYLGPVPGGRRADGSDAHAEAADAAVLILGRQVEGVGSTLAAVVAARVPLAHALASRRVT